MLLLRVMLRKNASGKPRGNKFLEIQTVMNVNFMSNSKKYFNGWKNFKWFKIVNSVKVET